MTGPDLSLEQWRIVYDTLEAATPIGAKPKTPKDRLAWYERSEIIQSIKSHFGWRSRQPKRNDSDLPTPEES